MTEASELSLSFFISDAPTKYNKLDDLQTTFISYSSGVWKFPQFGVWLESGSWFIDYHLLAVIWHGGRGKGTLRGFLVLVAQSCLTLCNPMDCSPPGSSVHGILQARILAWVAIPFSRGSSQPRDQIQVSCIAGRFFTIWGTREAQRGLL